MVPMVNASGKGRNVYYSKADLLALSVMEHLLSIGLNFEICHVALETLRKREPWLFEESVTEDKMKRLMFLPSKLPEQPLQLAEFDQQAALEELCQGQTVIPLRGDSEALLQAVRIHEQLRDNLNSFSNVVENY
ncbi:MAG: MerR family transcriptional regulator [Aphanizomenon sp.]